MGSPKRTVKTPEKEAQSTERAEPQLPTNENSAAIEAGHSSESAGAIDTAPAQPSADDDDANDSDDLEADEGYADSAFGSDNSDSTSITSSIYQGYMENGRRYQTKREGEYWGPSDEKQTYGCRDVADKFPSVFVQGVDLAPVPDVWVPPNCKFEVDDILKPWQFKECGRFELVHLRLMTGAFSDEQWRVLYKQAYKHLAPGGWIEQIEPSISFYCDDNTLPAGSDLHSWGPLFLNCAAKSGRKLDTEATFPARIKAAGFVNFHEKVYKVPLGDWAKGPMLKEAGLFQKAQILEGLEGYAMFLLTHFGEPTPWAPEEVQVYLAKIRNELNHPSIHVYHRMKRVWAQKPYETEPAIKKPEVVAEHVA